MNDDLGPSRYDAPLLSAKDCREWRESLKSRGKRISAREAADMLGVGMTSVYRYEREGCDSLTIALAMTAVSLSLPPWHELPRKD